mgnify:CR=1 FL=1
MNINVRYKAKKYDVVLDHYGAVDVFLRINDKEFKLKRNYVDKFRSPGKLLSSGSLRKLAIDLIDTDSNI